MSERWIKASEVGEYLYCQRAWWYRLQGVASTNVQELARGSEQHSLHGWSLRLVNWQRLLAYSLIFLAVVLLIIQLFP